MIHARLTATAAEILDSQPEHVLDLGLERYLSPAELLADLDVVDRVAARQRQRGARRRPAGPAAGSRARLRFSSVRPGHAAELRRARGGGRRVAGLGGCASRLRSLPEAEARRTAGRRTGHPQAADQRRRRTVRAGPQGARHRDAAARAVECSGPTRCPTTSSRCANRCPTCSRRRSCSRRLACSTFRSREPCCPRRASSRCSRRSTTCSAGASILEAALDLPLYRALVDARAREPGSHARLLRLQQGRRIPGGQLGALPRRAGSGRVGAQDRNPVAALPRSRRHGRPRRRPELRRDPGAAAGSGERVAADHRAGRGDRRQIRRAADRASQPRDSGGGHVGVHPARRRGAR